MNLRGKAISFEGGEGVGKTTVITSLITEIKKRVNIEIVKVREPGGSDIAEQIREVILNKKNTAMFEETEALLLAASRAQLLREKVIPDLEAGKFIIYDRFVDSSYAYQGGARGLGIENVIQLNNFATNKWLPDRTYLFDLDPEIGLSRIRENQRNTNRLDEEPMEFHYNIRKYYLEIAKRFPERIVILDANRSPELIVNDILNDMNNIF